MAGEIFAYCSVVAGLCGVFLWIKQEASIEYRPPSDRIPPGVYRLLEQARERFFHGSGDVRFTIFGPDEQQPEFLRPIARLGWGRPSAASTIRFRKGEGMAGKAWEQPGFSLMARLKVRPENSEGSSSRFKATRSDIEETCRKAQQDIFNLPPETAAGLSIDQLCAHTLIATSLMDGGEWFKGVLCIDFRDSTHKGLDIWEEMSLSGSRDDLLIDRLAKEPTFWTELARMATNLAALLPSRVLPRIEQEDIATNKEGSSLKRVRISETLGAVA